ncbi:MAG: chorismate mutase [Candidatus Symbiodolus clandestinus]
MADEQLSEEIGSLNQWRERIGQLDQQLLTLLSQRQQLALKIGHYKQQQQLPFYDPQREQKLLKMLIRIGEKQQLPAVYITRLYQVIFQHSLAIQEIACKNRG